ICLSLTCKMAPVVIMLVSDGSRCLLAHQAMFPLGMYSALSSFCDMRESHFLTSTEAGSLRTVRQADSTKECTWSGSNHM
uniref:Uncharacterized protein n=1 Tax=Cyprinus carpio TaxID=7962 RepID=A0A8C1W631_CYPCA